MTLSGLLVVISIAVAVLSFVTGILVLAGTRKQKASAVFLFLFMIGASIWSVSACLVTKYNNSGIELKNYLYWAIMIGSIFSIFSFVGYNLYEYKIGRILLPIIGAWGVIMMLLPAFDISIVEALASVTWSLYSMVYSALIVSFIVISLFAIWYRYKHATINKQYQASATIFTIGVFIMFVLAIVFNFVLPSTINVTAFSWIAPLLSSTIPVLFLYSALKQHEMSVSSNYLVAISYAVFICSAALIQISLSVVLDILLFNNDNDTKRLILIYSAITSISLLIIVKIFSSITEFLRSILSTKSVNLGFVLSRIYRYNLNSNLARLSTFLMEHLHVEYIGIIRNGKLYSSNKMEMTDDEVSRIFNLVTPNDGIWQVVDLNTSYMLSSFGIKRIAELKDYSGNRIGQILVGKPIKKNNFDYNDLRSFNIIFNEIAFKLSDKK